MQFTFNILQVTLTQKIITHRVSKILRMDMREFVWVRESFFNHDKWEIKLNKINKIIFPNSHSTLYIIIIYANLG